MPDRGPADGLSDSATTSPPSANPASASADSARPPAAVPVAQAANPFDPTAPIRRPGDKSADQHIGMTLSSYRLIEKIGSGGMAVVYRAYDEKVDRYAAVKLLPNWSPPSGYDRALLDEYHVKLARFEEEARNIARLNHPNVVQLFEHHLAPPVWYLVLEYLSGGSMADRMGPRSSPLSLVEATVAIADAASGLAAAHRQGMVHRDIKPANLLVSADGRVKIADFGLAKIYTISPDLTQTGMVMGTPNYMSPEQCEDGELDGRSDIYSLGCTYYALLTGKDPFADLAAPAKIMQAHADGQPLDLRAIEGLPYPVMRVIRRATQPNVRRRYQDADSMAEELDAFLATLSVGRPKVRPQRPASKPETEPVSFAPQSTRAVRRWTWSVVAVLFLIAFLLIAFVLTVPILIRLMSVTL